MLNNVLHITMSRRKHVLRLLVCKHNILHRILSALEVVKVVIGVAGEEDLCQTLLTKLLNSLPCHCGLAVAMMAIHTPPVHETPTPE